MFSAACAVDYSITVAAGPEEETSDGTAKVLLFIIISQIHANGLPHFAGTCPIKTKKHLRKGAFRSNAGWAFIPCPAV